MSNVRLAKGEASIWTAPLFLWIAGFLSGLFKLTEAACVPPGGCNVALAYYTFNGTSDGNLSSLATRFQASEQDILSYSHLAGSSSVKSGQALLIPFSCQCGDNDELGHNFSYTVVPGDQADTIASDKYEFLTTVSAMTSANGASSLDAIYPQNILKIPVNCSCGDPSVSTQYGLFATYIALPNDNLEGLAKKFNVSSDVLQSYNKGKNLNLLQSSVDVLFVPERDGSGVYPPFNSTGLAGTSKSNDKVVGASVAAAILLAIAGVVLLYMYVYLPRKRRKVSSIGKYQTPHSAETETDSPGAIRHDSHESADSHFTGGTQTTSSIPAFADRSVEFSYEELADATDNFSIAKKIGQGGYGSVFYGELRGQKLAVKVMNLQASKEFMAELNVLTRVHHTNLVRLVGYCTVGSLFLVYEYVENGTLSQHLKASGRAGSAPLEWPTRINIALDSARGLEYIHEHTTPTYIHRDIKSSNILLDKNFHAKVADFGLTRLTETGGVSNTIPSRLVGTWGYMAPEYARFGDVSAKADVYSFGVVLFEIISAKEAIVHVPDTTSTAMTKGNSQGLVTLFEKVLNDPDGKTKLRTLVDPALGDDYPLESVWKMANLAGACTREEPLLRPTMRVAVVALMSLSSSTQEWESDYGMESLISGR